MNPMSLEKVDFAEYLKRLSFVEMDSIKPLDNFAESVADFAEKGQVVFGSELPWNKANEFVRLGTGKLSIWAGESASGKSLILGQVITKLLENGEQALIASLEMPPRETIYRMICQSATCKASRAYCLKWIEHFRGKLFIYDELDRVDINRILGMCHYAAHELGLNHVVIDSLTKCGVGRDDYAKQAAFVDRLQWCAKTWDIHIHLVCHMRKSDSTGKSDIRGASEITDLADNVFILDRNRVKEKEMDKANYGQVPDEKISNQGDAYLKLVKNRQFGFEKDFVLWFDLNSGVYKDAKNSPLRPLELNEVNNG